MNFELDIWVVGGDLRQIRLAELLARDGHRVHIFALGKEAETGYGLIPAAGLSGVERADCVILPLPVLRGEGLVNTPLEELELPLARVLDRLNARQIICAGMVGPL
ncbi:MAG: dipicolinate synthase subunit DpsA, partial [Clostridiales bacterium]|nr:dipicolinate synthase subunit DpsA [Clostridiales bacterium]